ncbi:PREDICTED: V-set and immunoglobulin domain-containing protein 4-like [Nipponia nippon]|uniref:V-set and immunoglobulin domain-containing protein 4-like n=1 Tax=Nipponia nippon TaxID=128390 RepID=UPI0005116CB3|nr:PREDICTED: V-set and immunoglobulin domain-containing protein 4-like [Nipponia nippon]
MGTLVRAAVLMSPLLFCNAFLDLTGPNEIEGVWKGPTTLPCIYVPVKGFVQQTLTWTVVRDQRSGTVFRRDGSGDHVLLSEYRDRVSVLKDDPGNVSLHILSLEVSDRGIYTCQVTWSSSNNSLTAREITTKVEVVKGKPKKEAVQLQRPISYRCSGCAPGGKALLLSSQAELVWDSLRLSDAGEYYCEAENRAGAGVVQQSDAVELTVRASRRDGRAVRLAGSRERTSSEPRGRGPVGTGTGRGTPVRYSPACP